MKLRSTTPDSSKRVSIAFIASVFLIASLVSFLSLSKVNADNYSARIKALESTISRYDAEAARLAGEADTLQREVSRLNNEKAAIQAQVDLSQAKVDELNANIKKNEQRIDRNKEMLGKVIADLYVDDGMSTLEMLASSKGIGEYIDKQEYRTITRDQVTSSISEIKEAKRELEEQKKKVESVLTDQTNQRNQLASKEQEQQTLLNQTRGDEAEYKTLSTKANSQKEQLQREQQAAIEAAMRRGGGSTGNVSAGDPNKGGYPSYLANSNYYAPLVDPWGMYSRQCVSYTAWKVHQKTGNMPYWGGVGNANQWPSNARRAGIPVSTVPRAGSVGVLMAGQYGHVVWVESVNGNGTINISQYNYYNAGGSGWGHYSEMYNVSPGAYDYYIYF